MGQAGLYQAIAMFLVAYFIISMTVLSVCAISTNGALDAGGAYCILFTHKHHRDDLHVTVNVVSGPLCMVKVSNKYSLQLQ